MRSLTTNKKLCLEIKNLLIKIVTNHMLWMELDVCNNQQETLIIKLDSIKKSSNESNSLFIKANYLTMFLRTTLFINKRSVIKIS